MPILYQIIRKTYKLAENDIGPTGAAAIAKSLVSNKTLAMLNLSSIFVSYHHPLGKNQIGDEAGKSFGEALCTNRTLNTLELGNAIELQQNRSCWTRR